MARLSISEKVLDIGCGRGEMSIYAQKSGCEVVGIDYSQDAIDMCKELLEKSGVSDNPKITFLHIDENHLPFSDDHFDVIFFLDVWEHIYPEQIAVLLKEFRRVLKKGGRLIIQTSPNKLFFEKGFPMYTYYFNYVINRFIFQPLVGRTIARAQKNPRSELERVMHINEQTRFSLGRALSGEGFDATVEISDYYIMFSSIKMFFYYLVAQPFYVPFFKDIFGEHIWAVAKKRC